VGRPDRLEKGGVPRDVGEQERAAIESRLISCRHLLASIPTVDQRHDLCEGGDALPERAWRDAAITNQSRQPAAPPSPPGVVVLSDDKSRRGDRGCAGAFRAHVREALAERHP
jgi:hypothetical protein